MPRCRPTARTGHPAFVPGDGVVQVAAGGGPSASGRAAPGAPRGDQVPELAAGLVAGFGVPVVAAATGDQAQPDSQGPQVVLRPGLRRRPLARPAATVAASPEVGGHWWRGLRRQADEQALLAGRRPVPVPVHRPAGALGLRAILPASRERFCGHEPPSVQENQVDLLHHHGIEPAVFFPLLFAIFFVNLDANQAVVPREPRRVHAVRRRRGRRDLHRLRPGHRRTVRGPLARQPGICSSGDHPDQPRIPASGATPARLKN